MRLGPVSISCDSIHYAWIMRDVNGYCGIFRNRRWIKPGRWGFWILGFEFGSRNPGNKFGIWLKHVGLWPF